MPLSKVAYSSKAVSTVNTELKYSFKNRLYQCHHNAQFPLGLLSDTTYSVSYFLL